MSGNKKRYRTTGTAMLFSGACLSIDKSCWQRKEILYTFCFHPNLTPLALFVFILTPDRKATFGDRK